MRNPISQLRTAFVTRKMRRDWDARARDNASHFVNSRQSEWDAEEFLATGEDTVRDEILCDMDNICQSKSPGDMRVLEIGCGVGRVTRALAKVFGEVHGVDISGEMIARARETLRGAGNAFVHQNSGADLAPVNHLRFDFAYSSIVFQHIPSKDIIEAYVREVSRLLPPGALFKFQVQDAAVGWRRNWYWGSTWHGVSISRAEAAPMAERHGFELRHAHGEGTPNLWLWFFKR